MSLNLMVSLENENAIGHAKPMFHNFGSYPRRAELARSGAIPVNSS